MENRIASQQKKLESGNPVIRLAACCRPGDGIAVLTDEQRLVFRTLFENEKDEFSITHFIPASGSGSRMFDALYSFAATENPDAKTAQFVETFLSSLQKFAFYDVLPATLKAGLEKNAVDPRELVRFILTDAGHAIYGNGLNFGGFPKGLIPFHRYVTSITNAFEEHVLQALQVSGQKSEFHFTINDAFKTQIVASLEELKQKRKLDFSYSFSIQDSDTDAIAFDEKLQPAKDEKGELIKRPAGHGALLNNLDAIHTDLVFVRNIDNIQHNDCAAVSVDTRKVLAGALIRLQDTVFSILAALQKGQDVTEKLQALNLQFDLRIPAEKFADRNFITDLLDRPIRVCGMVKNEGQPGGGPFWIEDDNGMLRRQVVEKSQISNDPAELQKLNASTHFNPVELVCSFRRFNGDFFKLHTFRNDELYFIVSKTQQGKPIRYIEEPGLWNGSMDKWTTVFYEIDSACFSPVKTVLDLLQPLHQGDNSF